MLNSLQFVQGAVAQKNHIPILQHFRIHDGYVRSHNGVLSLSAPIECDLSIQPVANTFVHAITLCEDTVALYETDTGRLAVTSGNFKAYIDTSTDTLPQIEPQGDMIEAVGLLEAVKALAPIMGEDASRPWSRGILFVANSAFATNNVVLVEHWLKYPVSRPFGLPAMAINELLRIGEEPVGIQISKTRVTFHFKQDRNLTTSLLLINNWPNVKQLLQSKDSGELFEIDESFFKALQKLRPFTKDTRPVWLNDNEVSTTASNKDGAHLILDTCHGMQGTWALDQILKLKGVADYVIWEHYPKPCPFFGKVMRGIILGIPHAN